MKKILVALLALVASVGIAHAGNSKDDILRKAQQHAAELAAQPSVSLRAVSSTPIQPFQVIATGATCDGSVPYTVIHDDGEAENGYGWNASANVGRYADKFVPQLYPASLGTVCVALITNTGVTSFPFSIAVYDDDGVDGAPGTLLGSTPVTGTPSPLAGLPATPVFEAFDLSSLGINITSGSVYISVEWDAATAPAGVFIASDLSNTTPHAGGYSGANAGAWVPIEVNNPDYNALFIRATLPNTGAGAPGVSQSFTPVEVLLTETSTLSITLDNRSQATAAVLSADFINTFPTGLVVAATPNAASTCINATLTATAGAGSITLGSGAEIPAQGTCTISVDVAASSGAYYENVIAAGALQTQHGSNPNPANAIVKIGFAFPEPYCPIDFTASVEPITQVAFADIDNSSDATVDGSPALENFTSIIGNVDPGASVQMVVEGNTNGSFTTVVNVYIDWNQNAAFDANEGYLIGEITNSTGTDDKQAIATITVPIDAVAGETRMRVTKNFLSASDACDGGSFGQAEDYTLDVAAVDPSPKVTKAFSPTLVLANDPSTLTLTLTNDLNTGDATLTAPFTDTFPAGLVVAATPNASTTCTGGTVTASAGTDSVTLSTASVIPGGGSCVVTVDVSAAVDDVYTNVIPAGALQTDLGNSPFEASAELQVGYIFPQPYCDIDFTIAVEPITRVLFDGIDNSSDAVVDGSPALEDFTAIIGNVRAGRTLSMTVEGNTAGDYTTVIQAYIDWNQNFVFDAGEGYLIGEITNSTGTDGAQAVADIQIPLDALTGTTRMRVTKQFLSAANACGENSFGQAEDYTLEVAPAAPGVSKAFAPGTVQAGDPSTATITLTNSTAGDATLTTPLVDTFPAGLALSNVSTNCGLVIGAAPEQATLGTGEQLSLPAGIVIPGGGSCEITATVLASAAGIYTNVIAAGDLQTDQGNNPDEASATLTVVNTPTVAKTFAPSTVQRTESSTATITLSNPSATDATLTAPFTDEMPTGVIATSATTTCIAAANSTAANLAGGSVTLPVGSVIPANGSCELVITVYSDSLGTYVNEIPAGALQTDQGNNLAAASATLTVVANPVDPVIDVSPQSLTAAQASNAVTTQTLNIANTGGSELTWTTAEIESLGTDAPSFKNTQAKDSGNASLSSAAMLGFTGMGEAVVRNPLGGSYDISQMADNTPGDQGVSCGTAETSTADNSWWRRFYFDEHPQVGSSATVLSVTISTGSNDISLPTTINLYSTPHAVPVDTIDTAQLTLIGTTTTTVSGALTSISIPVTGPILNTVATDLVVEWHTEGNAAGGQFFPGANATPQTHPTFISSATCSINEPTPTAGIGFPDFHLTMIVNMTDGVACNATDLPWLSLNPTAGTTAPGATSPVSVTFDSTNLASGTYTGGICINSNDPVNPVVNVPVSLTVDAADPVATVTPSALLFSLAADETASQTVSIANASGSDPLTFSINARGPNNLDVQLEPTPRQSKLAAAMFARNPPSLAASNTGAGPIVQQAPWTPLALDTGTSFPFMWDDGSAENAIGWGTSDPPSESLAVFLNRFSPPEGTGAYTITDISILWPDAESSGGPLTGLEANLVVYYDFDGDGDPSNAFRLGDDQLVTIATTAAFESYPVSISVPGDGDIYVGFANWWARAGEYTPRLYPAALDQTTALRNSYLSADSENITDIDNLANNDITAVIGDLSPTLAGNWLIRAVGTTGTTCVGPPISWLSAAPASGSVNAAESVDVTVTADPSAAGLGAGTYQAELCISTNDPTQPLIAIPVTLTVTLPDAIFCSGFEIGDDGSCEPDGGGEGGIVDSGVVDWPVPDNIDGLYINWATGCHDSASANCPAGINFNPFTTSDEIGPLLGYFWPTAADNNCVSTDGTFCDDLVSGAVIGPSSALVDASPSSVVLAGGTSYMGFAFRNSDTGEINYGYVQITSTGPNGIPLTINQYWYDSSGAAITIP